MSSSIYYQIFGQALTLAMHAGNSVAMLLSMQNEELLKDQDINNMISMQSRYLTVWNIVFQLSYFSLAFACDFLTVTGRDNLIPKSIRTFRQTFFTAIIFPVAVVIFIIFWPFFIFNRELLFPAFIDKIFSFKSNMVMHFFILPAALCERVFLPRSVPKSHRLNIGAWSFVYLLYLSFIHHTYNQRGLLPYPIFKMIYGTIYYLFLNIVVFFMGLAIYLSQWKFYSLIWGQEKTPDMTKVKFS